MMSISELDATTGACAPTHSGEAVEPSRREEPACAVETSPRSVLSFAIPQEDRAEFRRLPSTAKCNEQSLVQLRLSFMRRIYNAERGSSSIRKEAARIQRETSGRFSAERLRKLYQKFTSGTEAYDAGDWRLLIDRRRAPAEERGAIPYATISFYMGLVESNQRCAKAAWRELKKIWRTKYDTNGRYYATFPGYPKEWPVPAWHGEYPKGCSYDNLQEHAKRRGGQDDYTLTAARIGLAAASAHRPKVYLTRKGLRLGQQYQFDDHELNLKVHFPNQTRAMRPRGFFAYDRLSGSVFANWFKPTFWDDDELKKKTLTGRDFMFFVIGVLLRYGVRTDELGTEFVLEHGTAAIDPESRFEKALLEVCPTVRIARGGRFGKGAHAGQYDPSTPGHGRGNFRRKAGMEGFFNILDNYVAVLRGQVGKDRLHAPEQIQGMDREHGALVKIMANLPPELAARIESPFLKWPEFFARASALLQEIDSTRDHECEGWDNFMTTLWRPSATSLEWFGEEKLLALPAEERAIITATVEANAELHRTVRMSRREVHQKFRRELSPVPWCELPALLGPDHALINKQEGNGAHTVRQGVITLRHEEFGPGRFYYDAVDAAASGRPPRFRNGDKFLIYGNPMCREFVTACHADGSVAGIFPRVEVARVDDVDAQLERVGYVMGWEAERKEELNARHRHEAELITERREHNAKVREQAQMEAGAREIRAVQQQAEREARPSKDSVAELLGG